MRRVLFLVVIAIILIGAGFVSIQLSQNAGAAVPGVNVQTTNPEASVLITTPQKGALFVGYVVVLFAILGGLATGLAALFWFLNRQVVAAHALPNQQFDLSPTSANPNSMGVALARHPAVTIGVLVIVVVGAALAAALLGLFSPH